MARYKMKVMKNLEFINLCAKHLSNAKSRYETKATTTKFGKIKYLKLFTCCQQVFQNNYCRQKKLRLPIN